MAHIVSQLKDNDITFEDCVCAFFFCNRSVKLVVASRLYNGVVRCRLLPVAPMLELNLKCRCVFLCLF